MARGRAQNRELVRLTPFQFSISISVVVLLMAGAGMAGYLYGLKMAAERSERTSLDLPDMHTDADSVPAHSGTPAPLTFYTVLTESRQNTTVPERPRELQEDRPREVMEEKPAEEGVSILLQVASYRGRGAASDLLGTLSGEGYSGTIQVADLGERGVWYRVRIGPYGSENEARRVLEKLRNERNLKGYIVR